VTTIAELIRARVGDHNPALVFEDRAWTYDEYVQGCADRAALFSSLRQPGPPHVGVLLENVPEFPLWLGAAALARATVVGINPTRRGAELAGDIRHTDCQLIVTDSQHRSFLEGLDLGLEPDRILDVDAAAYTEALRAHAGAALPDEPAVETDVQALIFTSGTSGSPKAVVCSQGRLAYAGYWIAMGFELTPDDALYVPMPLFHSMALNAGWVPALAAGARLVLRRRFSASAFLDDVRHYAVTYFNYVGKPLSFILATPEQPDDADTSLRLAFGNEAGPDAERFARRFGCTVFDAYGATEGGANVWRTPDTPVGSLGPAPDGVTILDPDTGEECPPARFDEHGRLVNAEAAIGELVNRTGAETFEGYWNNDDATAQRLRAGVYWTGDLAYRDEQGFLYFAGRGDEWLRVDGENFAAAPVERILNQHADVVVAAVYAVPAADSGDEVMAALELRDGASFDAPAFEAFLAAHPDLGTKWSPRFVRVSPYLPLTETKKVVKRELRAEHWECGDPVWWRRERGGPYVPMTDDDRAALRAGFDERGRAQLLTTLGRAT
jgi:fatty-acyl-CoA synthase